MKKKKVQTVEFKQIMLGQLFVTMAYVFATIPNILAGAGS